MDDFEKIVQEFRRIRRANKRLLKEFESWLKSSGLKEKTIHNHLMNIDFYINEFLLSEDAIEPEEGVGMVDLFLGYWFIKKALWASPASMRGSAASLKKFYTFMYEKGSIEGRDLIDLKATIKEDMPEWLKTLGRYDDPSVEEVW